MTNMSHDRFLEATGKARWATIDEFMSMLDDADYWDEEFTSAAVAQRKKIHIRGVIRNLKDKDGWPVFASVVQVDSDGNEVRIYKQETFFDRDDYMQVVSYHVDVVRHHVTMAVGYRNRAKGRYGMQIPLPDMFEREGVLAGD